MFGLIDSTERQLSVTLAAPDVDAAEFDISVLANIHKLVLAQYDNNCDLNVLRKFHTLNHVNTISVSFSLFLIIISSNRAFLLTEILSLKILLFCS